jgi:hypothetical protein
MGMSAGRGGFASGTLLFHGYIGLSSHTLGSSVRTPNREDDPKAVKESDEVAK